MQAQDKTEPVALEEEERPLAEEYRFDYGKARPNRFAGAFGQGIYLWRLIPMSLLYPNHRSK